MGVSLLDTPTPPQPTTTFQGRRVTWDSWWSMAEVEAAAGLRAPRWQLTDFELGPPTRPGQLSRKTKGYVLGPPAAPARRGQQADVLLLRLAFHPAGARSCPAQAHTFYLVVPGARQARELIQTLHRRGPIPLTELQLLPPD